MPQHEWSVWRMSRAQWVDFVRSAGPHMRALLAVKFRRTLMWFKRASVAVKSRYKDAVDFFRWLFEKLLRLASSHAASIQAIAKAFVRDASDDAAFPVEFIGADAIAFAVDGSAAVGGAELAIATDQEAAAVPVDVLVDVEDAGVNAYANPAAFDPAVMYDAYARRREANRAARAVQYPTFVAGRSVAYFTDSLRITGDGTAATPQLLARAFDIVHLAVANEVGIPHQCSLPRDCVQCERARLAAPLLAVFVVKCGLSEHSDRVAALFELLKAVVAIDETAVIDLGDVLSADRTLRFLKDDTNKAICCVVTGEDPCPVDFV